MDLQTNGPSEQSIGITFTNGRKIINTLLTIRIEKATNSISTVLQTRDRYKIKQD